MDPETEEPCMDIEWERPHRTLVRRPAPVWENRRP